MMRTTLRRGWVAALALALACCLALPLAAQTDVTSSRISGTVTDTSGAKLPGVTVEAKNTETGLVRSELTDANGFFNILNLPTGTYDVSATLDGFATATASSVRLLVGTAPSVNFSLPQAKVSESIVVTAEQRPVVEVTNTSASTTIQAEQIKNLPVSGRNYANLVYATPETRADSERGNISISGQRGINTNVTVDGVDYNDPFFGGTVGAAEGRAPLSLSQETIKEFSVITNGASAEFGRSSGGFVNVITKSGTNAYRGSVFYYDQPKSLTSDFADGRKASDQKKQQYGLSFGGPIIKDKLFFFASYDKQKQDLTVPIATSVLDPTVFAKYPVLASPADYIQGTNGSVLFGRVDWQMSESQHFLLRLNNPKYDGPNGTSNSTTRSASYNGVEGMNSHAWVGSWSSIWGSNFLNDLNLNYVKEDTPRADKGLNLTDITINNPRINYGEVSFLPIVSTTKRKAFGDTFTFTKGDHVAKFGAEYNDTSIDQIFKGNWRGVYVFNTKDDLLAGKWAQYRQFGGLGGLTSDQAGQAAFGQKETAAFVQDQWFVTPQLTVQAGLRWEKLDNPNDPILNQNDRNANGSFNLTGHVPDSNNQLSPRIGISWSPDAKTAVRLSAGRYWARTPGILLAQLYTSNGLKGTQYTINAKTTGGVVTGAPTDPLSPGWGANFNPQGVEPINFTKIPTPTQLGVFALDPNFKNQYTDRITIGGEREILPLMSVALDYTYARGHNVQRLTDINLQYDGTVSSVNGLPVYSGTRPDPFYGRITTGKSDGRSLYNALTGTLVRRYANHWSLYGAVTYSKDKDNDSNERNFSGIQAEDVNNLDLNYGYSNRDQRWKSVLNGVWDTPWWGIGISGVFRYATGSPYNVTVGTDLNKDGFFNDRPTINGQHIARNSERQPDFYSLDLRLSKGFDIGPGDLKLFVECFNCSNAANRSTSNTVWGSGQTPSASFGKLNLVTNQPRTLQLALRYDF